MVCPCFLQSDQDSITGFPANNLIHPDTSKDAPSKYFHWTKFSPSLCHLHMTLGTSSCVERNTFSKNPILEFIFILSKMKDFEKVVLSAQERQATGLRVAMLYLDVAVWWWCQCSTAVDQGSSAGSGRVRGEGQFSLARWEERQVHDCWPERVVQAVRRS